jgi:hypothetical protein
MAGPQDIQRYPRGLIGLLGMQATGDTPHTLAQSTAATLECMDFYLNDRLEVLSAALGAAPAALGNFQFVGTAVPAGQLWMLTDIAVNCGGPVPAAAAITFAPVIFRNQALAGNAVIAGPTVTATVGENRLSGAHYERPNLILPGQSFGVQVQAITGVPALLFQVTAWFARLAV